MAEQDIHMAYHLERLGQGKTVYLFSPAQVSSMQDSGKAIEDFADDLMKRLNTHVFVHQNMETFVYRIGQVLDQFDFYETRKLVLVYVADPNKPRQVITTPPPASPIMGAALQSAPNPTISMGSSLPSVVNTTLAPQVKKIPKPANSWILYRKSKHHLVVAQNPGMHTSEISTIIGKMWKIEDPSVKAFWQAAADNEKKAHALRNPGYRITPRKSSAIKRRKTKKTSTVQVSDLKNKSTHSYNSRRVCHS
ncbi:putative Mating-type protein a-1 [Glarea lozoyensis 74030]|uniref:Putative Mating-type protein a-1 n=1 Tax=Glarea lozoyensis (strain ATCC 74030 / MF5533) TaxID=1104152 RepID=H0EZM6_GLAL7|nr:putative Mating-type protein a-1 [Glarea lozoyensis 74030]